jgi:RNA polymerase sigma factor (TIGR02999 family)
LTTTHALEDELTGLLRARRAGDDSAGRALFERLYGELRQMARRRLANERPDHTLAPTSLVHEVFLRLDPARLSDLDREEFLLLAATAMRRILVDSARRRLHRRRVAPEELERAPGAPGATRDEHLLVLDDALDELNRCDPGLARVVELRFLAGLGVEEAARVLGVSSATVKRDWRTARAFLQRRITAEMER